MGDTVHVLENNLIQQVWSPFITEAGTLTQPTPASAGTLECQNTRIRGSKFTTSDATVKTSFEISRPVNESLDSVLFALETTGANNFSISEILTVFDINTTNYPPIIGTLIDVLKIPVGSLLPQFQVENPAGSKNGCWIVSLDAVTLELTTALTFSMIPGQDVDFQSAHSSFKDDAFLQLDPQSLKFSSDLPLLRLKHRVIVKRLPDNTFERNVLSEIIVELPISGFLVCLKTGSNGMLEVGLLNYKDQGSLGNLLQLLANGPSESEAKPSAGILDNIKLWKMNVRFPRSGTFFGDETSFKISFIAELKITSADFLFIELSYDTRAAEFSGSLLFQDRFRSRLDPNFNDLEDLPPKILSGMVPFYDLASIGGLGGIPKFIPTRLVQAFISYTNGFEDAPYELNFSAALVSSDSTISANTRDMPMPFDWAGISFDYHHRGEIDGEEAVNAFSINSTFALNSSSGRFRSGSLAVALNYTDGGSGPSIWALSAGVRNIQLGAIIDFFEPGFSNEVLEVVGKLNIDALDVLYTIADDTPTSFLFSGIVTFGGIRLKFFYQYVTKKAFAPGSTPAANQAKALPGNDNLKPIESTETFEWRFDAYLDPTIGSGATVGQIADSIADNASGSLPSFIRDIQVTPADGDHLVGIHCSKVTSQTSIGPQTRAIFLLNLSVASVEFTVEQLSTTVPGGDPTTKRIVRVSAGKLPLLSSLPVIKELPQPWQKLQYMWSPTGGLTRDEVTALNDLLKVEGPDNLLYFKASTKDDLDASATDTVVLVEGHHFVVVYNNEAVLDHVFGSGQPKTAPGTTPGTTPAPGSEIQEKPPSKGPVKLNIGSLDVTAVSLQYKDGHLWVFIDATLGLGPLSLSLIGFGIGLYLGGIKFNDLSSLLTIVSGIDFQLHGMEVAFDKPPILIAGCFYHDVTESGGNTVDAYRGGIAVSVPPYTFVAVGEYAIVTNKQGQFKSVFVFAKLDGPIIDFEFAILKGLRIGFGYNSMVRSPAVEELAQFPLIDNGTVSGAGNHPMAILEKMQGGPNPFVQMKQGEIWIAFGFTISSFDLINATIVALVQFGDVGCIFSLFGDLSISYPPVAPDAPAKLKLFNIEILMLAELNFVDDVFKLEAALAPTSFVLVPYCRLFGGLALYTFFGSNPHAGDWVLSVGGYHRAFDIPPWYPRPGRIGLDFNIAIIHIRGEAYFAITPKAIMTGCMIRCELSLGPVYAWLDAAFDAMVQFSPLHYWVSMHVEVGVKCDIPLLFCTLHIKISIGAGLAIQGPEFGGTAYVDFWFFSFSFDFGTATSDPKPISLEEFYALCEKSGPPDTSPNNQAAEGLTVRIKMSLEEGSFSMPSEDKAAGAAPDDTGAGSKWYVKGGSFQFRVSSVFALTSAYIETQASSLRQTDGRTTMLRDQDVTKMQQVPSISSPARLSSLPMKLAADPVTDDGEGITSKLCIAIQDVDKKGLATEGWKPSFIMKAMPQTLWADLNHPPDRLTREKGTIDLPMAVTFAAPKPILAQSRIPEFNATDMAKLCAGGNLIPQLPPVTQTELLPELLPTLAPEPPPTQQQIWASMQQIWAECSNENLALANSITELCMTTLGWDKPPADIVEKATAFGMKPWEIPVAFPSRMVNGTGREVQGIEDGLDSFYLELPRTTAALVH